MLPRTLEFMAKRETFRATRLRWKKRDNRLMLLVLCHVESLVKPWESLRCIGYSGIWCLVNSVDARVRRILHRWGPLCEQVIAGLISQAFVTFQAEIYKNNPSSRFVLIHKLDLAQRRLIYDNPMFLFFSPFFRYPVESKSAIREMYHARQYKWCKMQIDLWDDISRSRIPDNFMAAREWRIAIKMTSMAKSMTPPTS
jgi:hypothetical protein